MNRATALLSRALSFSGGVVEELQATAERLQRLGGVVALPDMLRELIALRATLAPSARALEGAALVLHVRQELARLEDEHHDLSMALAAQKVRPVELRAIRAETVGDPAPVVPPLSPFKPSTPASHNLQRLEALDWAAATLGKAPEPLPATPKKYTRPKAARALTVQCPKCYAPIGIACESTGEVCGERFGLADAVQPLPARVTWPLDDVEALQLEVQRGNVLAVKCPECDAPSNHKCRNFKGGGMSPHGMRK